MIVLPTTGVEDNLARGFYEISRYRSSFGGNTLGTASNSFVIAEWRVAGGTFEPPRLIAPRHIHYSDDEAWYVLDGKLRVEMGDKEAEVPACASVMVPRGTPHTYCNPGPEPVRYLLIMTPNIYRLIQNIHTMRERTPAGAAESLQTGRFGISGIDKAQRMRSRSSRKRLAAA